MSDEMSQKFEISAFSLKIIAIIAMTFNHIAHAFIDVLPVYLLAPLYVAGGLTFPIMAYLMIEGYHKTSNLKKYMLRLLIFALIAVFPFFLVFKVSVLNVLFTFLLGLICLYLHDRMKNRALFWLFFVVIVAVTLFCDWPLLGVPMILMFGLIKKPGLKIVLTTVIVSLMMIALVVLMSGDQNSHIWLDIGFNIVILATIPLLFAYNGKRGYSPRTLRYLFYIYYPAHLFVIGGIAWLLRT